MLLVTITNDEFIPTCTNIAVAHILDVVVKRRSDEYQVSLYINALLPLFSTLHPDAADMLKDTAIDLHVRRSGGSENVT